MALLGFETYAEAKSAFQWDSRWQLFDGGRDNFNLAHECLGRHVAAGCGEDIGARIVRSDGAREEFTFGDLEHCAVAIAALLKSRGVGPGDAVAVRLESTREFIAALYAAFYLGAVFVPCTPQLGSAALVTRIKDARPRVTLLETMNDLEGWLPDGDAVDRDTLLEAIAGKTPMLEKAATKPEDPAIYIYSSGTTGRPKRTTLQHQAFTYLSALVGKLVVGIEPKDRYIACYNAGYLGGFGWGLIVPMSLGTAGGIYTGRFSAKTLLEAIEKLGITALHCPPTAYRRLVQEYDGRPLKLEKLAYTAEAMDAPLAERIHSAFGQYARGQYGATEVGMIAIDYAYRDYHVRPGTIGKALFGHDVLIVDDEGEKVATGEVGRIALRRKGRLLFSGDFGFEDEDGYFWFRGRTDNVIITSGYTIAAEEIEEVLLEREEIRDAAVVAKPNEHRGSIIKAFIELRPEVVPSDDLVSRFQDHVRERLGGYAYPREISFVTDFERNEAGKISRKALRDSFQ